MRDTIADIDLMTIEHLDFEVMCESTWHAKQGQNGVPDVGVEPEPAVCMVVWTCPTTGKVREKLNGEKCKNYIQSCSGSGKKMQCVHCGTSHPFEVFAAKILPIK